MSSRSRRCAPLLLLALALAGCGPSTPDPALPSPVVGERDAVSSADGAPAPATYDVTPGADGRVFLVLDCLAERAELTATRTDGLPWSPPELTDGSPTAAVACRPDGARLALLVQGDPGVPVPMTVDTGNAAQWRISQTDRTPTQG